MTSLYDQGMAMRREVLGNEHVDRSMGNVSEFAQPVQEFVTEFVWGGVRNRDGLDLCASGARIVPGGGTRARGDRHR